jgi:serine/threonine-protein kinase RsbW
MQHALSLELKREVAAFDALTPAVNRFLAEHGVPGQVEYKVHLVLEEILLNLIRHVSTGASESIRVQLVWEPHRLRLAIEEESEPFDPRTAAELKRDQPLAEWGTGGMGLHLVRKLVDGLDYEHRDGCNRLQAEIAIDSDSK